MGGSGCQDDNRRAGSASIRRCVEELRDQSVRGQEPENFRSPDALSFSVDDPNFSPAAPARFLKIIGEDVGYVPG
jgi:hypothetical protein